MGKLRIYFLYLTIFITGAVILVIEIAGTRVLAPFYGSTIYVWSSLISITLGFLALGYWFGGKLADKKPDINLLYRIIFLAGAVIIFTPQYASWVLLQTSELGLRFGPLIAALTLFAIPLFLLGIVSPFAIKIQTKLLARLGITAGGLYALSTLGSLLGGLLAGFYLAPNFSVRSIIISCGLILIFVFAIWQIMNLVKES